MLSGGWPISQIRKPPIHLYLAYQLSIVIGLSLVFYLFAGHVAGYSSLSGGIIFLLPQAYFMAKAFRYSGARATPKILLNIYKGESAKIVLVAAAFAVFFKFVRPFDTLALFFTFTVVLVANAVLPYFIGNGAKGAK